MTFSIIALDMPIALIGYTALSVLRHTIRLTRLAIAASRTFSVPKIFVLQLPWGGIRRKALASGLQHDK